MPRFVPNPTRVFPSILKSTNAKKTQELGTSVLQIFRNKHIKDTKQRKLLQIQSDPDLQTARFQGRNTGNGCSAARFLRRNTDLGSGTGC